mgnify:FL=1
MRRMREDHLHRNYSDVNERPIRCRAKLIQPKAGMAARLAMIPSAYNGTFCPATAASNGGSSERSSEGLDSRWALPGAGSFNRPTVREVVSNRTEQKNFKKYNEGRSISGYSNMLPTKTGAALCFISELKGVFSKAHSLRLYDLHVTATNRASESREHSPPIGSPLAAAFPLQRQAGMPRCVSAQRHQRWPDPDISSESRRRWRLLPLYRTCFPSHSANRHHCNTVPLF